MELESFGKEDGAAGDTEQSLSGDSTTISGA